MVGRRNKATTSAKAQTSAPTAQSIAQSNATLQVVTGNIPRWQTIQPPAHEPTVFGQGMPEEQAHSPMLTASRLPPHHPTFPPAQYPNTTGARAPLLHGLTGVTQPLPPNSHPAYAPSATSMVAQPQPTAQHYSPLSYSQSAAASQPAHNSSSHLVVSPSHPNVNAINNRRMSQPGRPFLPGSGGMVNLPSSQHVPTPTGAPVPHMSQPPHLPFNVQSSRVNATSPTMAAPQPNYSPQLYSRTPFNPHRSLQPPTVPGPQLHIPAQAQSRVPQASQQQLASGERNTRSVAVNLPAAHPSPTGRSGPTTQPALNPKSPFRRSVAEMIAELDGVQSRLLRGAVPTPQWYLLRQAVLVGDAYYIILHQVLSLHHARLLPQHTLLSELLPQTVDRYLEISGRMLVPTQDTTSFFNTFPEPITDMCDVQRHDHEANRNCVKSVVDMIKGTVEGWLYFAAWCKAQQCLPLVEDLVRDLRVYSPTLQLMIFIELTRVVSGGKQGPELSVLERLHLLDQKLYFINGYRRSAAEKEPLYLQYRKIIDYIGMPDSPMAGHASGHVPPDAIAAFERRLDSRSGQYFAGQSPSTGNAAQPAAAPAQAVLSPASPASSRALPVPPPSHILPSNSSLSPTSMQTATSDFILNTTHISVPTMVAPNMSHTFASAVRPSSTLQTIPSNLPTSAMPSGMMPASYGPPVPHGFAVNSQASESPYPSAANTTMSSQPQMGPPQIAPPHSAVMPNPPTSNVPHGPRTIHYPLLYPPIDELPRQSTQPNPSMMALHQAHLRSPILRPIDTQQDVSNLYRCVIGYALRPTKLPKSKPIQSVTFSISKAAFAAVPKRIPSAPNSGRVPVEVVVAEGSREFRLRCAKMPPEGFPTEVSWVLSDTHWSHDICLDCNGEQLEQRRKLHYRRDLPINLTTLIKQGPNILTVFTNDRQWALDRDTNQYAIAVEVVGYVSHATILENLRRIPLEESIDNIKRVLAGKSATTQVNSNGDVDDEEEDDDMTVTSSTLTIKLFDPYSSTKIFDLPVRGAACRHRDCFDLETFLANCRRPSVDQPTVVDCWRCPICRDDVRPQSLVLDEFLVAVRKKLARHNQLDTRAIVVEPDGSWRPEVEKERNLHVPRGRIAIVKQQSSPRPASNPTQPEVIEID